MTPPPKSIDTKFRPMKEADAERALRTLGFTLDYAKGSHQQWRQVRAGRLYKVTLAPHRGQVQADDVRSMIRQAGVTRTQWYWAAEGELRGPSGEPTPES